MVKIIKPNGDYIMVDVDYSTTGSDLYNTVRTELDLSTPAFILTNNGSVITNDDNTYMINGDVHLYVSSQSYFDNELYSCGLSDDEIEIYRRANMLLQGMEHKTVAVVGDIINTIRALFAQLGFRADSYIYGHIMDDYYILSDIVKKKVSKTSKYVSSLLDMIEKSEDPIVSSVRDHFKSSLLPMMKPADKDKDKKPEVEEEDVVEDSFAGPQLKELRLSQVLKNPKQGLEALNRSIEAKHRARELRTMRDEQALGPKVKEDVKDRLSELRTSMMRDEQALGPKVKEDVKDRLSELRTSMMKEGQALESKVREDVKDRLSRGKSPRLERLERLERSKRSDLNVSSPRTSPKKSRSALLNRIESDVDDEIRKLPGELA